jgi:hypothetical protein
VKGCLSVFLGLLVLGLIFQIFALSWPVCLPTVLFALGWFLTFSTNPIKKAGHSLFGPIAIGLLLTSALLVLINLASPSADAIGQSERLLIHLDNILHSWGKLTPISFTGAMIALLGVTFWIPSVKAISRFFLFKKWVSRVAAIVGAATSFTLFTNVAVVQPRVPAIYLKVEAVYRSSKAKEQKEIDRYLSAKAIELAFKNQSIDREYVEALFDAISAVPYMDRIDKNSLAGYVAEHIADERSPSSIEMLSNEAQSVPDGYSLDAGIGKMPIGPADKEEVSLRREDCLELFDNQLAGEKVATQFADQAVQAAKESLSYGSEQTKDIAWAFVDRLIGEESQVVNEFARPFINKVLDAYFDKYTQPLIQKQSELIKRLLTRPGGGASLASSVHGEVRSGLGLMGTTEASLAREAVHEAADAARAAATYAQEGDSEKSNAEFARAQESSSRALKDAKLSKEASESLSKLAEGLSLDSEALSTQISATAAVEAIQAARMATEAAEAVRLAESTKKAVQAANAARTAEETAEAVKTLLKVIPK